MFSNKSFNIADDKNESRINESRINSVESKSKRIYLEINKSNYPPIHINNILFVII